MSSDWGRLDLSCSGWKEVKLGEAPIEIIDGDRGKNYPKGFEFMDHGFCLFLNAKNVTSSGFSFQEKMFISREKDFLLRKGKLQRHDIVLTTRGTVGNVGYFSDEISFTDIRINSGMVILRCSKKHVMPEFAYWLFRSPFIQSQIYSLKSGSAQPQLPISIMKNITLLLPPLNIQEAIVKVVSCLDDKIELNNRINKTLEEMAQAIFKSWFVDFEPFKDGEFEDSELGPIPKGWRVGVLSDIAEITMGQSPRGSSYNEYSHGLVFYQGRTDFGPRYPKIRLFTTEPKRMADKGDILLSVRAPVGDINIAGVDCCIGRGLAALKSKYSCNSHLYYLLLTLKGHLNIFNGEGTVFGSISKESLHTIKIIVPPESVILNFQDIIGKLDEAYEANHKQIEVLTDIRDTLLPKLMSGQIRVPIEEV